jgi:hypothetical protein
MAVTVSGYNYTLISDCNSDSSQGTHSGLDTQDTEYYRFGSASLCGIFKSTSNTHTFTPTSSVDLSGTGVHVRWQMVLNQGSLLKTYANDGVNFWASDGTNTGYWKVSGSDLYPGGWQPFVIDVSKACDSGTKPSAMNAITSMGFRVLLTGTAKNAVNTWLDHMCVCDGLQFYGDDSGNPFDFDAIATADAGTSLGIGSFRKIGGKFYSLGRLVCGDASGSSGTKFNPKSQGVVFEDRRCNASLYGMEVVDNGTGTTEFISGSKSGDSGIEGCTFEVESLSQDCKFTFDAATDTDVDFVKLYGTTMRGASSILLPPNGSNVESLNCTWETCGKVVPSTSIVKYFNIISAVDRGIEIASASHNVSSGNIINCPRGVHLSSTADVAFSGIIFTGGTYDCINTSGSSVDVSKNAGSNPDSYDPAESEVTFSASFKHTLTDMVQYTEVTYVRVSDGQVLFHVEDVDGTGSTEYTHSGGETVDILIHHVDYQPGVSCIYNVTLPNSDASVKIQQFADANYYNP